MKKLLLLATIATLAAIPAKADVILNPQLSGTGDNVIFDTLNGSVAVGLFNGQHTGFVDFTDLSGNPLFTGAQNGNDIKISNTNNLKVQVFNTDGSALGTTTQVFSLKGTGDVHAALFAVDKFGNVEAAQNFDLGVINPNAQSGFTFSAINGEVMTALVLLDVGGTIADYEHYRIDAAVLPVASVPVPGAAWLFASGIGGLFALSRRRKNKVATQAAA
jgi:hypothetical protein